MERATLNPERNRKRRIHKGLRILDRAIDHLGPTKPCGLMIVDGKMSMLPNTDSNADAARAILVRASLELVREL